MLLALSGISSPATTVLIMHNSRRRLLLVLFRGYSMILLIWHLPIPPMSRPVFDASAGRTGQAEYAITRRRDGNCDGGARRMCHAEQGPVRAGCDRGTRPCRRENAIPPAQEKLAHAHPEPVTTCLADMSPQNRPNRDQKAECVLETRAGSGLDAISPSLPLPLQLAWALQVPWLLRLAWALQLT